MTLTILDDISGTPRVGLLPHAGSALLRAPQGQAGGWDPADQLGKGRPSLTHAVAYTQLPRPPPCVPAETHSQSVRPEPLRPIGQLAWRGLHVSVQRGGRPRGPKSSEHSDCALQGPPQKHGGTPTRPGEAQRDYSSAWDGPQGEQERGPQEEWLERLLVAHTAGRACKDGDLGGGTGGMGRTRLQGLGRGRWRGTTLPAAALRRLPTGPPGSPAHPFPGGRQTSSGQEQPETWLHRKFQKQPGSGGRCGVSPLPASSPGTRTSPATEGSAVGRRHPASSSGPQR